MKTKTGTRTARSATGIRAAGRRASLLAAAAPVLLFALALAAPAAAPEDAPADAKGTAPAAQASSAQEDEVEAQDAAPDSADAKQAETPKGDDAPAAAPAKAVGDVDNTRKALEKWVETRRLIAEEKRDWALGREMLNERIELVKREIASLRDKIRNAEESIGEAEKKRADLVETNDKLKTASDQLNETVIAMENRTRELLQRLPDSIRADVKPLSQQFPEKPEESKLSLGIRFQNVVGVLNHLNKRNRDITVTSEVREFEDGTSAEVTTLYVGISQAYYVSADATLAGVGTATDEGWVWMPVNEAAPQIALAVAILKNEKVASFVRLPVEVH